MMHTQPFRHHAIVVEDEPAVRSLAAVLLEETEFDVIECESAEAALAAIQAHEHDIALIFTDIELAGVMDGVALAQVVEACWPEICIIVTSGADGRRARDLPTNAHYMAKPWRALDVLMIAEGARANG